MQKLSPYLTAPCSSNPYELADAWGPISLRLPLSKRWEKCRKLDNEANTDLLSFLIWGCKVRIIWGCYQRQRLLKHSRMPTETWSDIKLSILRLSICGRFLPDRPEVPFKGPYPCIRGIRGLLPSQKWIARTLELVARRLKIVSVDFTSSGDLESFVGGIQKKIIAVPLSFSHMIRKCTMYALNAYTYIVYHQANLPSARARQRKADGPSSKR